MLAEQKGQESKGSLAAIIVAAGYSFRMKQFKPLLPLRGSTVLEQAVHSFLNGGIKDIRVVVGHRANELFPILGKLGVKIIVNANFPEGMFSSVSAGIKSLPPEVGGFFLLPADNPIISSHTIKALVNKFNSNEFGIIYPSYRGVRGHPPLISRKYIGRVLAWDKPGGMKSLLKEYENDVLDVDVIDPGILLDMDTLEDYHKMLKYCSDIQLPSEEECYELIRNANTPLKVIDHCKQVAQLSCAIGNFLVRLGCTMNLDLIRSAALLHDLAKGEPHHAQAGAEMLVNYPEVAKIVAEHMDIRLNLDQPLSEKEIVYLADKLVIEDRIISLRDRFANPLEQHKNDQMAISNIKRRFSDAEKIQSRIEEIIKIPLRELWETNLEG